MPNDAPTLNANKPKAATPPSRFYTEYYGAAFLFLIALFVLGAFFVVKPEIDRIKQSNADTQALIQQADAERTYLASLDKSVSAAQVISPTVLAQVDRALPNDVDVPGLLVQIGSAAANTAVRVTAVAFSPPKPEAPQPGRPATAKAVPVDINLSLNANAYFDVKRFLASLESSLRLMDVIAMTTSGGGAGQEMQFSLQLRTYIFQSATVAKSTP